MAGSIAVALPELEGEAFGEARGRRCRADRSSGRGASTVSTAASPGAEALGDLGDGLAEIAGLVDRIDEVAADEPLDRVARREIELRFEMLGEGRLARSASPGDRGRPRRSRGRRRCRSRARRTSGREVALAAGLAGENRALAPGRRCRDRSRAPARSPRGSVRRASASDARRAASGGLGAGIGLRWGRPIRSRRARGAGCARARRRRRR